MSHRNKTGHRSLFARMLVTLLYLCVISANTVFAVEPDEMLDDPAHEARARALSKQLSCPVCSGETIDESHSEIAKSMRLTIREQIQAGRSNDDILDYVASRYGDHVLLRTPLNARTFTLWAAPLVLLLLGGAVVWRVLATNRRAAIAEPDSTSALSDDETEALDRLLGNNEKSV